jgi:hypothetical protein
MARASSLDADLEGIGLDELRLSNREQDQLDLDLVLGNEGGDAAAAAVAAAVDETVAAIGKTASADAGAASAGAGVMVEDTEFGWSKKVNVIKDLNFRFRYTTTDGCLLRCTLAVHAASKNFVVKMEENGDKLSVMMTNKTLALTIGNVIPKKSACESEDCECDHRLEAAVVGLILLTRQQAAWKNMALMKGATFIDQTLVMKNVKHFEDAQYDVTLHFRDGTETDGWLSIDDINHPADRSVTDPFRIAMAKYLSTKQGKGRKLVTYITTPDGTRDSRDLDAQDRERAIAKEAKETEEEDNDLYIMLSHNGIRKDACIEVVDASRVDPLNQGVMDWAIDMYDGESCSHGMVGKHRVEAISWGDVNNMTDWEWRDEHKKIQTRWLLSDTGAPVADWPAIFSECGFSSTLLRDVFSSPLGRASLELVAAQADALASPTEQKTHYEREGLRYVIRAGQMLEHA